MPARKASNKSSMLVATNTTTSPTHLSVELHGFWTGAHEGDNVVKELLFDFRKSLNRKFIYKRSSNSLIVSKLFRLLPPLGSMAR